MVPACPLYRYFIVLCVHVFSPLSSCYPGVVHTEHELCGHLSHLPHSQGPVCHQTLCDLQHARGILSTWFVDVYNA